MAQLTAERNSLPLQGVSDDEDESPGRLSEAQRRRRLGEFSGCFGDPTLLRGTTPAVLLGWFGERLRSSVGGLGSCQQTGEGDPEYAKSFQVSKLDIFLSHSWHAFWLQKWVLLLLHFNLTPALVASVAVGLLCSSMVERTGTCERIEFVSLGPLAGLAAFFLVLFSWHFISVRMASRWTPTVFLDKVCIHQTDLARKEQGIKSIGSILGRTNVMLVAWDKSYFSRLWCVYELSAFKFAKGDSKLIIRSMQLSLFVFAVAGVSNATYMMVHWFQGDIHELEAPLILFFLIPFGPAIFTIRNFSLERQVLKQELKNFSVRQTLCFCCTHGHKHPETGMPLLCDREHVYDSIAQWYGAGHRELGLNKFDETIRGQLKRDLHSTLGKWWVIPYRHAVLMGLPSFHLCLAWNSNCYLGESLFKAFELLLCRFPLCSVVTLSVCRLTETAGEKNLWATLADVFVVLTSCSSMVVLSYVKKAVGYVVGHGNEHSPFNWLYLCWVALQAIAVLLLYVVLAQMPVKTTRTEATRRAKATLTNAVELVGRVVSNRVSSR
eukprot:TRINITY_DN34442_c0_g1_i1.p1 TRINITY_DN34442_c0_g1~~TRINITY_DN34442_c0_g1_i1.p1  ORF type:complete len:550 (-),score=74.87 TRINITY_DN34442_c0_g1_i1:43-1692(-)